MIYNLPKVKSSTSSSFMGLKDELISALCSLQKWRGVLARKVAARSWLFPSGFDGTEQPWVPIQPRGHLSL